jgi:hypothetical protein
MKQIGWAIIILWLAGLVGLIDFHICIKEPGQCKTFKESP